MAEYRLSRRAQRDLDEIYDYTVVQWSLPQAMRYTDNLEAALAELAQAPLAAESRPCDQIRKGYRRRHVGRHVVYYRPTPYGVAIVRVLHDRMDAPRHL
jgi:toxin ParE1/3/4